MSSPHSPLFSSPTTFVRIRKPYVHNVKTLDTKDRTENQYVYDGRNCQRALEPNDTVKPDGTHTYNTQRSLNNVVSPCSVKHLRSKCIFESKKTNENILFYELHLCDQWRSNRSRHLSSSESI